MKRIDSAAVLVVVALFSCLSALMTLLAASLEEKYFETRDNFIRQFEKASVRSMSSMKNISTPLLNSRSNN